MSGLSSMIEVDEAASHAQTNYLSFFKKKQTFFSGLDAVVKKFTAMRLR
jgi:hypothetical protein